MEENNEMKRGIFALLSTALVASAMAVEPVDMAKRTEELKSLKWGMFVCWSFSTFSDKEWTMGVTNINFFAATEVDTDQWARTAKEAGMGYILFLTKHHDGFCLWDTKTTDRKVTKAPLGRDVLAELRKSCDKFGLKLALYFSEGEFTRPGDHASGRYGAEMKKAQLKELLTEYGPIEYLWLDKAKGQGGMTPEETYAWCKSFQPGCFVGRNKSPQVGTDIRLGEMGKARLLPEGSGWLLNEMTYPIHHGKTPEGAYVAERWFYTRPEWESIVLPADKLYADYLAAVKTGTIFELNVGPDRSGKLRAIDVATLREIGAMIRANSQR
jgi:alpha-L-fucosidase